MTQLSSNEMNAWLKDKEYDKVWTKVNKHLDRHAKDVISANKFLTALAFHLYHTKMENERVAREAADATVKAVDVMAEGHALLDEATVKKVMTSANNLIFRGFLRDGWIEASLAVCGSVQELLTRLANHDLAAFFGKVKETVGTTIKLSLESLKGDSAKEVKAMLKAMLNELAREQLPLRTLGLHKWRLELLYLLVRHSAYQKFEQVKAAVGEAINYVRENPTQNVVGCGCDRVFVVTVKFADFLAASSRTAHLLDEELYSARDAMLVLVKAQVKYSPSPRSLKVWCHLFENPRDSTLKYSESVASELSRLASKSDGSATSKVLRSFAAHCKFRLSYHRLREKMANSLEVEPRARKSDEEMEAVKDIGDVNPYVNMSKEQEEQMLDLLLESLNCLSEAFEGDDYFSHAFRVGVILGMIHSTAEYLCLSGYLGQARRAFRLMWRVAKAYKMENYKRLAMSNLLRCTRQDEEDDMLEEGRNAFRTMDKNADANETPLWQLVTAVAWRDFHNGRRERAFKLCRLLLAKLQESKNASSMDAMYKVAKADALTLMAHLRSCPGAFVSIKGEDKTERLGPLEFANEAFRYSLSALKSVSVQSRDERSSFPSLSRLSQLLMATRVHWRVLLLRYDLFSRVRMPKEMRLYAKMAEEVVQTAAIPIRFLDAITTSYL